MMIFLTILKIIGLVLLSILGVILFVLLLVLFVPLRYKIEGGFAKKPLKYKAFAQVTWLLGLLNVSAQFDNDNGFEPCLKLAGIKVYPKKQDDPDDMEEADYDGLYEKAGEECPQETQMEASSTEIRARDEGKAKEEADETPLETREETAETTKARDTWDAGKAEEETGGGSDTCTSLDSTEAYTEYSYSDLEDGFEGDKEAEHSSKIRKFAEFIKRLIEKTGKAFENISYTIQSLCDKIENIARKIDYYKNWWESEATQRAVHKVLAQAGFFIRAIRPRRLSLGVVYGDKDPSNTGRMYGDYAAVSPWIGRWVSMEPRFEEDILECDLDAKGRLQLYIVLIIAWKLFFDKNLRCVIKRFKRAPQ